MNEGMAVCSQVAPSGASILPDIDNKDRVKHDNQEFPWY